MTPANGSASTTHLFDAQRTGRTRYALGSTSVPRLLWSFRLRSYPTFAPESTSVFDADGHQYFGAHDGCFYSLTRAGELRWMFSTGRKIYSSPSLVEPGGVVFVCGDGRAFCLERATGLCRWVYNASDLSDQPRLRRKATTLINLFRYDYDWRQRLAMKAWGSPAVSADGAAVYVVSRGRGLQALDSARGRLRWSYGLGQPWNYLAGPALGSDGTIYAVSQRHHVHAVSPAGDRLWTTDIGRNEDLWGCPSVDVSCGALYVTTGSGGRRGCVVALRLESGELLWTCPLPGSTRGSAALAHAPVLAVACMNGSTVLIDRSRGEILREVKLVDAPYPTVWTTPAIDPGDRVLVPLVLSGNDGAVACIDLQGRELWRLPMGKSHATPIVDAEHRLFVGSWTGEMRCYQT